MDPTVQALALLLLKATPTILFLVLLTYYLKYIFFKPLERVLAERRKQTEGARKLAEAAFAAADQKASEFERALQAARAQVHKEQEALRQGWLKDQSEAIASARTEATTMVERAKAEIEDETKAALNELNSQVEALAEQILQSVTHRRAA